MGVIVKKQGSPEFISFLESLEGQPPLTPPQMPSTDLALVTSESSDGSDVAVRLVDSGRDLTAKRQNFPDDWVFKVGDRISVAWIDGNWCTIPEMVEIRRNGSELTFFVANANDHKREVGRSGLVHVDRD